MLHMKFLPFCHLEGSLRTILESYLSGSFLLAVLMLSFFLVLAKNLISCLIFSTCLSAILPQLSLSKQISWVSFFNNPWNLVSESVLFCLTSSLIFTCVLIFLENRIFQVVYYFLEHILGNWHLGTLGQLRGCLFDLIIVSSMMLQRFYIFPLDMNIYIYIYIYIYCNALPLRNWSCLKAKKKKSWRVSLCRCCLLP